jgi:hypothetical protein
MLNNPAYIPGLIATNSPFRSRVCHNHGFGFADVWPDGCLRSLLPSQIRSFLGFGCCFGNVKTLVERSLAGLDNEDSIAMNRESVVVSRAPIVPAACIVGSIHSSMFVRISLHSTSMTHRRTSDELTIYTYIATAI